MFLVREVLNCRPGKVGALVKKFKELNALVQSMNLAPLRLYTDVSGGSFWTHVLEREFETLDEMPALEAKVMADSRAQAIMSGYHDLVERGSREIYTVVS
jgi:hypothetical protein